MQTLRNTKKVYRIHCTFTQTLRKTLIDYVCTERLRQRYGIHGTFTQCTERIRKRYGMRYRIHRKLTEDTERLRARNVIYRTFAEYTERLQNKLNVYEIH